MQTHYQELKMNRQRYDNIVKCLKGEYLRNWNKEFIMKLEKEAKKYELEKEKLLKVNKFGLVRVLKEDEIDSVIFMIHNHATGGHFGIENTYHKIAERYYWKGMYKDIKEYVKTCDVCQRRGKKGGSGYLHPIKIEQAFERIGIDFIGPLEKTKNDNRYILVATDYLTKWPEAKAMKAATAENVAEFIYKEIICRHGCPKIISSDRGTHFRNQIIEKLCEKFKIKHKLSSPYHPQTNGLVERFNRTLCEALAKVSKEENQWDEYIDQVLFAYRTNRHSTTRRTPFYLTYGRKATLPIDDLEISKEQHEEEDLLKRIYDLIELSEDRDKVIEEIKAKQVKQKEKYDEGIKEETKLEIGDKVLLRDAAKEKQWSGKLSPKWKGPYYIHDIIGKGAYKLRDIDNGKVLRTPFNVKLLKRYYDKRDNELKIFV